MTVSPAVGTPSTMMRVGTLSPYDFAFWASTFIADGTPEDYFEDGPETTGAPLVWWAAAQVGVSVPPELYFLTPALSNHLITVDVALKTRGALLVGIDNIAVCMGLDDVVGVINGRYYQYKTTATSTNPVWEYGAHVPGLLYG